MLSRLSDLLAPLLLAARVSAFKDASPFLLLANRPLNTTFPISSSQVVNAKNVEEALIHSALLKSCAADLVIVMQTGLKGEDFQQFPTIKKVVNQVQKQYRSTAVEIPQLLGTLDVTRIEKEFTTRCGWDRLTILDSKSRLRNHKELDAQVWKILQPRSSENRPYVLVFFSAKPANDVPPYEMLETHPELHTDLRRDLTSDGHSARSKGDDKKGSQENIPLFEKYQFFTPGIFMGLSVSLILLMILYVGISAISGLEVSYAAFSKEMGPQAQKKQQ